MEDKANSRKGIRCIESIRSMLVYMVCVLGLIMAASCSQGGGSAGQNQDGAAGKGQSFSADMIVTLSSGQVMLEGKIFVTPDATRMDWKQGASNLSSIRIEQENREYLYNHDKKVFYEIDLNEDEEVSNFLKSVNDYKEIEVLGKEKVNGMNCTRKKVRNSFEAMGMSITNELIIWQADGIDFPIRAEGEEGTVTELKNISKKTPASKLFQPIEGYKRVNNMMEVMGFGGMGFGMNDFDDYRANEGDMEVDEVYDQVNRIMQSLLISAEDKAQTEEILAHSRELAKQMDYTKGAASGLWSVVPGRPGDKVLDEMRINNIFGATMGSNAPIGTVFGFYQKQLSSKGWNVDGKSIHQGQGILMMSNDGSTITISSADDKETTEKFSTNYQIQLIADTR